MKCPGGDIQGYLVFSHVPLFLRPCLRWTQPPNFLFVSFSYFFLTSFLFFFLFFLFYLPSLFRATAYLFMVTSTLLYSSLLSHVFTTRCFMRCFSFILFCSGSRVPFAIRRLQGPTQPDYGVVICMALPTVSDGVQSCSFSFLLLPSWVVLLLSSSVDSYLLLSLNMSPLFLGGESL